MMLKEKYKEYIHPTGDRYCIPKLNEVKFISNRQTMFLVLGSCISTVFLGKADHYVLAANHIVIAEPHKKSIIATKSAIEQIEEIYTVYKDVYGLERGEICCLHLIGAGNRSLNNKFHVHEKNIEITGKILNKKGINITFRDTGSHFVANYSISNDKMSVFVENKFENNHKSFILHLDLLLKHQSGDKKRIPASTIEPNSSGFELLVKKNIIEFITGEKK